MMNGIELAKRFHETYERLAPSFGYETRKDTKAFDENSPNGKLMIAVCTEVRKELLESILLIYKQADEERLEETEKAHLEAEKWKGENDMYGWNFHEGRSAGITWGSIFFYRVQKALEGLLEGPK